jgi:Tn3 transposase DDE domain
VIEHWNGANDFVFFARRGELASNRTEDHELSMLSLHLLQNCMVYINTLMMQQVLSRPHWAERLTTTDLRALTPLIWEHVNPYGLRAQYGNPYRSQFKWPLMTRLLGEPQYRSSALRIAIRGDF